MESHLKEASISAAVGWLEDIAEPTGPPLDFLREEAEADAAIALLAVVVDIGLSDDDDGTPFADSEVVVPPALNS